MSEPAESPAGHPVAAQAGKAWARLQPREKNVVLLGVAVALAALAWQALWLPSRAWLEDAEYRYEKARTLEAWMAQPGTPEIAPELPKQKSLTVTVTDTAKAAGIGINSLNAKADNRIQVRSAPASFAAAMGWLNTLETKYYLGIEDLEITKTGEGTVQILATLHTRSRL